MDPASSDTPPQPLWQISRQCRSTWRCWDGEMVIYDDLSGDTMKLDIIMSAICQFIMERPASESAITDHLASTLALTADDGLRHITATALRRLRTAALISPLDASDAPEPG